MSHVKKTNKLKLGFIQNSPVEGDLEASAHELKGLIKKAALKKPDIIFLPEIFLGGLDSVKGRRTCVSCYRDFLQELKNFSYDHKIWFYGSQFAVSKKNQGYLNQAFLLSPQKRVMGTYDKIHLFGFDNEKRIFRPGLKHGLIKTPWGKIAMLICYDLRFPELFRKQVIMGAKMAFICAQWPEKRDDHWMSLLKARAIENQMYVVACNRLGTKRDLTYTGHSCVISPWGEIDFLMSKRQKTGVHQIDLNNVDKVRQTYPFLNDILKKRFHFDI